jgi:hypothetical protein
MAGGSLFFLKGKLMKNFKPSDLPLGTTIEDKTEGTWTSNSVGMWEPSIYHCVDCLDDDKITDEAADDLFKNFEIVSIPYGVAVQLAIMLRDEYGTVDAEGEAITVDGLIADAIVADGSAQQREDAEKEVE